MATKYLHKSKSDFDKKVSFKKELIRLTKEKNYTERQTINLLKFISLILYLPKKLEDKFVEEVIQEYVEKPNNMYILKSQTFSNQLHLALYGETWTEREARIRKEQEEHSLIEKTIAVQKTLKLNKLSIAEIAKIMNVSVDFVNAIKEEM